MSIDVAPSATPLCIAHARAQNEVQCTDFAVTSILPVHVCSHLAHRRVSATNVTRKTYRSCSSSKLADWSSTLRRELGKLHTRSVRRPEVEINRMGTRHCSLLFQFSWVITVTSNLSLHCWNLRATDMQNEFVFRSWVLQAFLALIWRLSCALSRLV